MTVPCKSYPLDAFSRPLEATLEIGFKSFAWVNHIKLNVKRLWTKQIYIIIVHLWRMKFSCTFQAFCAIHRLKGQNLNMCFSISSCCKFPGIYKSSWRIFFWFFFQASYRGEKIFVICQIPAVVGCLNIINEGLNDLLLLVCWRADFIIINSMSGLTTIGYAAWE